MSDKSYEKLIKQIRRLNSQSKAVFIGVMKSNTSVAIGDVTLNSDDLLIAEHLKTGWYKQEGNTMVFVSPLKAGDTVLIIRVNDGLYAITERLVNS